MDKEKVVIEQPSFFPWCGYMGLVSVSDIFVIYDNVQFERRSWQSRNRIISSTKEWMYINVPTIKASRDTEIKDILIVEDTKWKKDLLRKLECEYSKTPYYSEIIGDLKKVINEPYIRLVDLNVSIIKFFCSCLDLKTPEFMYASVIDGVKGTKTDRLLSILEKINGEVYVTATGAKEYIEPLKFKEKDIDLLWYEFIPKEYIQNHNPFIPYMSVIDAIFNIGRKATKQYIEEIAHDSIFSKL